MVKMNFDTRAFETQLKKDFKKIEIEANRAAEAHDTPKEKAQAFAKVLRKNGIQNIKIDAIERKFTQ